MGLLEKEEFLEIKKHAAKVGPHGEVIRRVDRALRNEERGANGRFVAGGKP